MTQWACSNQKPVILICDDDQLIHLTIKHAFKDEIDFHSAYDGDEALILLQKHRIDLILLDVEFKNKGHGLQYIPRFKDAEPNAAVIIVSGRTDFETVRESMRLGADDYLPKDFSPHDLLHTIRLSLEKKYLRTRNEQQNFEVRTQQRKHVLIGESPQIKQLRATLAKVKNSSLNVIITGETGSGKEVIARQIRKSLPDGLLAPFVAIDSSTIQSTTAESQLFGHEKGAFTGADQTKKGIFEEADGGIVYFDEIANMPPQIQSKLLRVLQEKEITRLGSTKPIQLDFRVVCATNRDFDKQIADGQFMPDLFQRLNVVPIHVPPLRERTEDIPLLISHFCKIHASNDRMIEFTENALSFLLRYSWPGNVRELGNLIAYLSVMTDDSLVDVDDLPFKIRNEVEQEIQTSSGLTTLDSVRQPDASHDTSFYQRMLNFEYQVLTEEYKIAQGNISKMAVRLKMDRSHLYNKLKVHSIHQTRGLK